MAFALVLMQQFNDCLHPVIRSHAVLSFAAVETVILVEAMELVQLLCHLQCDPVVFHIPLHRAPALILRTDTGNELIVPALHKTILAHPGEPLAEVTPNLHLVIQVSRPDHRGSHIKIHKKYAHCIVLLNCFCRPIRNHV